MHINYESRYHKPPTLSSTLAHIDNVVPFYNYPLLVNRCLQSINIRVADFATKSRGFRSEL
uniref:Uncharacterized protein n=1 Tax=Lepeophtheirus salmonis TaxID=72036 RepID=A0A0K2V468_LEPSM